MIKSTGRATNLNDRTGQVIIKVFVDREQRAEIKRYLTEEFNVIIERAQLPMPLEEESSED